VSFGKNLKIKFNTNKIRKNEIAPVLKKKFIRYSLKLEREQIATSLIIKICYIKAFSLLSIRQSAALPKILGLYCIIPNPNKKC
jgi:hypothetical protein